MSTHYNKLITKLRGLFELDKADLDFGIYRIIGQRQAEITQLPNICSGKEHWKVRLIEEEFQRLMFLEQ